MSTLTRTLRSAVTALLIISPALLIVPKDSAQMATELYHYCVAKRGANDHYSNVFAVKPRSHAVPTVEYARYMASKYNERVGTAFVLCSIPFRTEQDAANGRQLAIQNARTIARRNVVEENWTFTGIVSPEPQSPLRSSPSINRPSIVPQPQVPASPIAQTSPPGQQPQIAPLKVEACQVAQVNTGQQPPSQHSVSASERKPDTLIQANFHADGLANEALLRKFYAGDFVNIDFNRGDSTFAILLAQYLRAYGQHCDKSLPANKVMMTIAECDDLRQLRRGYKPIGPPTCYHYTDKPTGIFADPDLYAAKLQLEDASKLDQVRDAFRPLVQGQAAGDVWGKVGRLAAAGDSIVNDVNELVQTNACTSPALRRFQENLRLFALNKPPIQLDGSGTATASTNLAGLQNYKQLLEDLILDDSKAWLLHRFVSGSVSNVFVLSRDATGRPARVGADYLFSGKYRGSVGLAFSDGLPECMYFSDFPNTCRTPNRRIVQAYAQGRYQCGSAK